MPRLVAGCIALLELGLGSICFSVFVTFSGSLAVMEGVVLEDVTDILALYEALETRERTDRLNAAADSTLFCQSDVSLTPF